MRNTLLDAFILVGVLGLLNGCGGRLEKERISLRLPQGMPNRPQGIAALTVNTGAQEPFTRDDVVGYFGTHGLPMLSGKGQFQVDTLQFLTSKQVSARLQGVSTGLADSDRVGFVTLSGTFVVSRPAKMSNTATFKKAYAAFDAATGYLLMDGTLESGKGTASSPN